MRDFKRSRARSAAMAAALCAIAAFYSQTAYSQSSNEVAAESLFREGRKLMDAGRYAEACDKLAASQRLEPAAGTLLNLATCLEKNGQTASAWATYRDAMGAARAARQTQREQAARARAEALEPLLPRLTIQVSAENRAANVQIKRDGVVVPAELWNVTVPVDPGQHSVEATAKGKKPWSTRTQVDPRAQAKVVVPPLEPVPAAATTEAALPAAAATKAASDKSASQTSETGAKDMSGGEESKWNGGKTASLILAGVGVAGIAVGAVEWFRFQSKKDDSIAACPTAACNEPAYSEALAYRAEADTARTVSIVAGSIGVASLATAVIVWVSSSGSSKTTGALRILPVVGTREAGLGMTGSW